MYYSHDRNSHNIVMMHQHRLDLSPPLHDHRESHHHHHYHLYKRHPYHPHHPEHEAEGTRPDEEEKKIMMQ